VLLTARTRTASIDQGHARARRPCLTSAPMVASASAAWHGRGGQATSLDPWIDRSIQSTRGGRVKAVENNAGERCCSARPAVRSRWTGRHRRRWCAHDAGGQRVFASIALTRAVGQKWFFLKEASEVVDQLASHDSTRHELLPIRAVHGAPRTGLMGVQQHHDKGPRRSRLSGLYVGSGPWATWYYSVPAALTFSPAFVSEKKEYPLMAIAKNSARAFTECVSTNFVGGDLNRISVR
jgi:hypothetical protein